MKYFGKKSWAAIISILLHIGWYFVLVMAILGPIAATGVIVYSTSVGDKVTAAIVNGDLPVETKDKVKYEINRKKFAEGITNASKNMSKKDRMNWEEFKKVPLPLKILMIPYLEAVLILMLVIIKRSRLLFTNFRKEVVFKKENVELMTKIGKLLIAFSIMTCNLSSLFLCVLLFMSREVFRNATVLQEEHDLTV